MAVLIFLLAEISFLLCLSDCFQCFGDVIKPCAVLYLRKTDGQDYNTLAPSPLNYSLNQVLKNLLKLGSFLSASFSEACASGSCFLKKIFWSPDFYEFRRSVMSICLFAEVKWQ